MIHYRIVIKDDYPYLHRPKGLDSEGTGHTICGMTFTHGPRNTNAHLVWSHAWMGTGYKTCPECASPKAGWKTCPACGYKTKDDNCPQHGDIHLNHFKAEYPERGA